MRAKTVRPLEAPIPIPQGWRDRAGIATLRPTRISRLSHSMNNVKINYYVIDNTAHSGERFDKITRYAHFVRSGSNFRPARGGPASGSSHTAPGFPHLAGHRRANALFRLLIPPTSPDFLLNPRPALSS